MSREWTILETLDTSAADLAMWCASDYIFVVFFFFFPFSPPVFCWSNQQLLTEKRTRDRRNGDEINWLWLTGHCGRRHLPGGQSAISSWSVLTLDDEPAEFPAASRKPLSTSHHKSRSSSFGPAVVHYSIVHNSVLRLLMMMMIMCCLFCLVFKWVHKSIVQKKWREREPPPRTGWPLRSSFVIPPNFKRACTFLDICTFLGILAMFKIWLNIF